MVLQDESEDELFKKHSELCNKLNLEPKIISDSWESYQSINKNFVLEVNIILGVVKLTNDYVLA